mgnify:CR=1 FL=1
MPVVDGQAVPTEGIGRRAPRPAALVEQLHAARAAPLQQLDVLLVDAPPGGFAELVAAAVDALHQPAVVERPDDLAARDVPFDEVVVFQELGVDPYLAVRSGETWYALYRWARPETLPIAGRALMRQV